MLYLETQKVNELMKTEEFQQDIGRNADCMNIITKYTKGCVKLSPNATLFYYIWSSGVKTEEEASAEEVDCCGPVNMVQTVFCLSTWEINEIVVRRVLSCYEYYSNISW